MGPGSPQKVILEHFQAQAAEWTHEAPESHCKGFSKPRPQNGRRKHPEAYFQHFQAQAAEWAQEAPRKPFWSISKPKPQNEPRKPPESHFGACPSPGRRMSPGSPQKPILQHFQAQAAEWTQEATPARFNRKNAYILLSKLWALSNASTI